MYIFDGVVDELFKLQALGNERRNVYYAVEGENA